MKHLNRITKKFAFLFACLLTGWQLNAQTAWNLALPADGAGSSGAETSRGVCTDASGNVYVVGVFSSATTDFDLGGSIVNFPSTATQDGFVASYDKNGGFRWAVSVSSSGTDFGSPSGAICTNGTYVWFTGVVNAGSTPTLYNSAGGSTAVTNLNAAGNDAIVAKLDCSSGAVLWAKSYGGTGSGSDNGQAICIDPNGFCYVMGAYTATFTLDGVTAPAPAGLQDIYIAKFAPGGTLKRIVTGGSSAGDMQVNGGGICYVPGATPALVAVGSYGAANPTFGTFNSVNTPSLASDGTHDAFLLELDTTLSINNAIGFGTSGLDELLGAAYDPFSGGVFVGGYFAGTSVDFPGASTLTGIGGEDIMLARYSVSGNNFSWARVVGNTGNEKIFSVTADGQGGILVAGSSASASLAFGSVSLTLGGGANDLFVTRYNTSGTAVWAVSGSSSSGDDARGVASYVQSSPYVQNVFVVGNYQNGAVFSPGSPSSFTLTGDGGNDFFLARINDASLPLSATQSQVNLTCNGVCTGSATVVPSGGISPYTYSWAPSGGSGATASSLCAGNFTVTITDATSTSITKTFSITQPPAITITPISQTNVACNGGSNGAAQVSSSGGTGTLTYNWTPGNPTGDGTGSVTGLTAQVYTVTVTDANSCTATRTFNITQPPALTVTPVSQTNVSCNGGSNGAASVSVSGGTSGYTYNWTPGNPPGDGTGSVTGLTAQGYTVTVTDANSCTATQTFNITQPPAITITPISQTNIACNGGSNGAAQATASGGTGTLTYDWTPGNPTGDGTGSVTGLTAQVYTVTVTDANSCTATRTFNITQPASPVSGSTIVTNVACFGGSSGAINLTPSGGTGPYTFQWLPSGPTTEDRTGLTAGTYSVQITDANGCNGTVTVSVTQPASAVSGSTVVTNVACFGGSSGAINLTPSGGTGPYTFQWLPSGPTTEDRTGLTAGTYSVQITDANGCNGTVTVSVTQPASAVSGSTVVTNVACFGGSSGAINLTPSGGTGPYTFQWLPSGPTTEDRTGLTAGTYSVQITDANGCNGTVTVSVTQPASAVSGSTVVTNVACFGGSSGAINLTPSGGTGPYTFQWLPSGPTTEDRTGLTAGTYSVQITDANGCNGTVTVSVTQPASAVSGSTVVTNVACFGGSNGAINLTPSGGTGPYTFQWLPSGPTTEDRTGLTAGTYSVQITDANGCNGTVTVSVAQPASAVSGTTVVTNVACFGGSSGAINLTPSGGTGPYTFQWLPSGPTTEDRTGLTAGTYSVQITDANGCNGTVTVSVTQPASAVSGSTVVTNVACFGGSSGAINLTPSGGTGPYTFQWLPSGPTTEDRTGLTAGTYSVQIIDANGCNGTVTVSVTQPASAVSGTTVVTNVSCFGGSNGAINLTPSGGTGPYTFQWLPSGPTTEDRTGLTAGTYSVQITDANSCTGTVTVTVTEPTAIVVTPASQTNVSCNGGSNGAASVTASGGTGTLTYNWTPGNPAGDGTNSVTGLTAGNWSVTVTDANSCTASATFNITEPPALTLTTTVTAASCNGGMGSATVFVTGGTPGYVYLWMPGNITTPTINAPAGCYTVAVTDANGCIATQVACITQPPAISIAVTSQTNVSCNGGSNGAAAITVTGGTGTYTYDWAPGSPAGDGTNSVTGLTAGNWVVTVTDANSCTAAQTITITEPPALSLSFTTTSVSCFGTCDGSAAAIVSGGTPGYTYTWMPGGQTTQSVSGLCAGNYTCTVTDANACFITASVSITEPPALSAAMSHTDVTCFGANDGSASVSVSGGTGSYTYSWAPVSGNASSISGLPPGTYNVTIFDVNGCSINPSVTITEPNQLDTANVIISNASCNGGANGSITVNATGGSGAYSYVWSTSSNTTNQETNLAAGMVTLTITDANAPGCSRTFSVTITEPAPIVITPDSTNVSCFGGSDGSISTSVTGGTLPYTYMWSTGDTTTGLTGVPAGCYTVTITDANNCNASLVVCITEPAALSATIASTTNPSTCGNTDGTIDVLVTGGTPGYTFAWSNGATSEDLTGAGAGVYTDTITDANGCTTTVTAALNDPNAPVVTVSLPTDTACSNFPAPITLSGESPAGGAWSGPGVSGNQFDPFTASLSPGMYMVTYTYTDLNGCTGSASDTAWAEICSGVIENTTAGWNIYPNPGAGQFTLEAGAPEAGTLSIEVFAADGRIIHREQQTIGAGATVMSVDLGTEPAGVYFVKIINNNQVFTAKLIRQ